MEKSYTEFLLRQNYWFQFTQQSVDHLMNMNDIFKIFNDYLIKSKLTLLNPKRSAVSADSELPVDLVSQLLFTVSLSLELRLFLTESSIAGQIELLMSDPFLCNSVLTA